VYRAKQRNLGRHVAIKVLRSDLAPDGAYAARFKREANAASKLDHPNLMRVYDFGEAGDGLLYIAMEFVDGRSLFDILRAESPLPAARVVDLASQLLAGLAAMHDERIVHRDLKPENVMVVVGKDDDGHATEVVKLCDFGIAKQVRADTMLDGGMTGVTHTATLTATGALVGTPEYMSPEQAKGDVVDARSDLYAVGVILYQLLTGGVLPFRSSNSMKVLLAHLSELPAPPSKHAADVDPLLEEICLRALAKAPQDRFQSAREMRAAMRSTTGLGDSAIRASRASIPPARSPSGPAPKISSHPPARAHDPEALTRDLVISGTPTRQSTQQEIAAAIAAAPASQPEPPRVSSVPARASKVPADPAPAAPESASSTLVSAAPQTAPSAPRTVASPAPPPATSPAAPASRANPILVALVVVLLAVIAVLVLRR
jgi:serine/threonine-protein kinase